MRTTVSSKGQIVLPAELRERDHIRPGQQFEIDRLDYGEYLFKNLAVSEKTGLVEWLLACPEKGWYLPADSETTDSI